MYQNIVNKPTANQKPVQRGTQKFANFSLHTTSASTMINVPTCTQSQKKKSDTAELLSKVEHLENTVIVMSDRVMALEERLQNIDIQSNPSCSQTFKCDQCDYKASKDSVLKRHKTSKHNKVKSALEQ